MAFTIYCLDDSLIFSCLLCFFNFFCGLYFFLFFFFFFFFFFFQAEDGIRDGRVTGVQTCALPILSPRVDASEFVSAAGFWNGRLGRKGHSITRSARSNIACGILTPRRSEEHTSNSSHPSISYAVFCLKKKKKKKDKQHI